jgi:hypothetical protein
MGRVPIAWEKKVEVAMRKTENVWARMLSAALLAAVFVAMVLAANSPRGQAQRGLGGDNSVAQKERPHRSDFDVIMTAEEKQVRDVYARLMRYHTAAKDALAAAGGIPPKPESYVVFELRAIHSGPIEEISGREMGELVTSPGGDAMKVTPHHLAYGSGPRHAYYDVEWDAAAAQAGIDEQVTLEGMLNRVADKYRDVTRYTSYEVTVKLAGKQRTYRALALHRSLIGLSGTPDTEIFDNVTPEMNAVLADESPRVIAPWDRYTKSGLYLAVARSIAKTEKAARPLIPAGAPIGYLPGDNVRPAEGRAGLGIAAACAKSVTVTGTNFVDDGSSGNFTVAVSGGTATSYQWTYAVDPPTGAGNNPGLNFTSPATVSTGTDAHWFAAPNDTCGAAPGSVYIITCTVGFSDGDRQTGEANMVVNGWWYPGGATPSATMSGGPRTGFDTSRNLWIVVDSGTLARVLPTPVIYIPATSQFYAKAQAHENEHVRQWQSGLFSDLLTVAGLMAVLLPLTDRTRDGLAAKLNAASTDWFNSQQQVYLSRIPAAERGAYAVSDPIAPRYLYQGACSGY